MSSENEPIRNFATFVDKAIPMAGLKTPVVTYRGGGPAVIALISGEIGYIFATAPSGHTLPRMIRMCPEDLIGVSIG